MLRQSEDRGRFSGKSCTLAWAPTDIR